MKISNRVGVVKLPTQPVKDKSIQSGYLTLSIQYMYIHTTTNTKVGTTHVHTTHMQLMQGEGSGVTSPTLWND